METKKLVLKMRDVKKSFGATQALRGVDLDVYSGEVHAIVGSNGAGKSTLMKTLAGEYRPDEGKIYYMDEDITGLSPRQIQKKGIQVVHQVLNIVDSMSILENILLGDLPTQRAFLCWKQGEGRVRETLDLIGIELDLNQTASTLSIAEQQFVILARAIVHRPQVLVLDEPTSRISMEETEKLFALIEKLKENGTTTIYISHRMEEIYRICDKISVFRDGAHIETRLAEEFPENELVASMLGKKLDAFFPKVQTTIGDTLLQVNNLCFRNRVNDVSFSVRQGEIVSLVGAVGAGKTEIVNAIFGILKADSGEIIVDKKRLDKNPAPSRSMRAGVALVPEDRALQGMIGELSVKENITSVAMSRISRMGLLDFGKEKLLAQSFSDKLDVQPNNIDYKISSLSGGNQQKVVVGKWLIDPYKLYLLDEVAAGVDIGAKSEIYRFLGELAQSGAGVLLSTGDIEEAMGLSDRIIVLYKGKVVAELIPTQTTKDKILAYIMGGGQHN